VIGDGGLTVAGYLALALTVGGSSWSYQAVFTVMLACKPERLSAAEFELVKGHSSAGAELVARIAGLEAIVPRIRHSHERYDGSGYPDGLSGAAIPLASRILLVADAFDAITSTRPYREALSVSHARAELISHAGSQFDPRCVEALLEACPAEPRLAEPARGWRSGHAAALGARVPTG
jgi:HD-GYP domain-containing protein (c-di-GMP phosphodiesterase class II)